MNENILSKLSSLPESSGVYLMYDNMGEIIYVGKAINLKRRVSQYFRSSVKAIKVQAMVDKVYDFSYVLTLSEHDALTLEANLIKKHQPRYNILLKDDKGKGVYFKVNVKLPYPNIVTTRRYVRDGAKYFGPMPYGVAIKQMLALIQLAYGVRTCPAKMSGKRECLNYHIGRCHAPCTEKISQEEYGEYVRSAMAFLSGKDDCTMSVITDKMNRSAESGDFERAIVYRDLIRGLERRAIKRLDSIKIDGEADIFAYVTDDVSSGV